MERFPITLNFVTIGAPPEVAWAPASAHNGFLTYASPWERRPIPEELGLRKLLDLDTENDDAVVAFLDEFGMIAKPYFDPGLLRRADQAELAKPIPRKQAACRVADARWYLRSARALTRHWIAASDGDDPTVAWTSEGFPVPDSDFAWYTFVLHLNEGLGAYAPHAERATPIEGVVVGKPVAGLYSGLCLQLANHLAEEAVIRRCGYCDRPFVRQLGGAALGQYRTEGVMYCTVRCAKNQAQREYRRRQKETK